MDKPSGVSIGQGLVRRIRFSLLCVLAAFGLCAVAGEAQAQNNPPTAVADTYAASEDTVLNVGAGAGVLGNDSDPDMDPLTAVLDTDVSHGTLTLNPDGSFRYTPAANFNGADSFTYHASDGSLSSSTVTVTLNVAAVNDAPVASADTYSATEDTELDVNAGNGVLSNDSDVDMDVLTAVLDADVSHGTLTLDPDGSFTYTPASGFSGPDSFTYHASDGSLSSSVVTVTLDVAAVNHPPTAVADTYAATEDTALNVNAATGVLSNDTDVDMDVLTAVLDADVSHGSLTLHPNGSFTYTPAANFNGTDSFSYHADDGAASSATVTVTLNVAAVNDPPVASADTYAATEDTELDVNAASGVLSNDTDVDMDVLTAVLDTDVSHGTLALNADGSFTYTPTAGFSGGDSFRYHASDGSLSSSVVTVTINVAHVNHAPTATADTYAATQDTKLDVKGGMGVLSNDSDPDGDMITAVLDGDVSNGTLTLNANGSFTYTPTTGFSGADSFTYHASDGSLSSSTVTVTINVAHVNHAPTASADTYAATEDTALDVNAATGVLSNDSDPDSDMLTAVLDSDVSHGTLALNADGSFTYTPTAGFSGGDSFRYHASDGSLSSGTVTVAINVTHVNHAPMASADTYDATEDTKLDVKAGSGVLSNDTDPDGDTLTAVLDGGVSHGTLTLHPNGSFSYTPAANFNGTDSFTYHASDGSLSSSSVTVTLTVAAVNDAPVASADTYAATEDTALNVDAASGVLGNDTDVDGNTLTAVLDTDVSHGTLVLNADGSFTYTPTAGFSGGDSFRYHASDGSLSSSVVTVTINVAHVNHAPTASADTYAATENIPLTVNKASGVLANDSDPDGDPIQAVLDSGVSHGVLVLNADGSFLYTPALAFSGADSFTYHASDGSLSSSVVTVTLNVAHVNHAPTASADTYAATEDTALNVNAASGVLANDTDPDGDMLTAVLDTDVSHGTLTLNPNGSFTYTPAVNFNGSDSFTYHASDGSLSSGTVTATLNVAAVNDAPVASGDTYAATEDTELDVNAASGVLSNDSDVEGDTLTAVLDGNVSHGMLTLNADGSFTYMPAANFSGADSFTYHASDGSLPSSTVTVTLNVANVNDPPVANADAFTVAEDQSKTLDVLANDTDPDLPSGDKLTIASVSTPDQGGSVTIASAGTSLSYTPAANFFGTETFDYTVHDTSGASSTATVTMTVTSVNDPPVVAVIPDQTVTENVQMTPLDLTQFVTDVEHDPLTFTLDPASDALPPGLSLSSAGVLSGTPTLDSSVGSYNLVIAVSDGQASVSSKPFMLDVLRSGRVDLAVTASAAPNPVAVGQTATWTFSIANKAPDTPVPSTHLHVVVNGEVPFVFGTPDPACTVAPAGNQTTIDCVLTNSIAGGASTTVELTGSGNEAGDVVATATVSVEGSEPVDETPHNDTAAATLSVAASTSTTPAQQLDDVDARAVAIGDLNGDGFADLVVATGPSQPVLVFLNVVDPNDPNKRAFSTQPISLGGQGSTNDVAVADLDGDGDLDIVAAGGAGLANQVFVNNGDATFSTVLLGDPATDSRAVAIADIDGDGFPDIVFGNGSPNDVYRNTGSGATFTGPVTVGAGDTRDVALVDLFGDGLPELVLANADGNAQVFANSGGTFTPALELPTGATTSVASADFNGDGLADLAFGRDVSPDSNGPSNLVFLNTTTSGNFFQLAPLGAAPTAAVLAADTDLDGDPDLVFINENGAHQIYANTGAASTRFVLQSQQVGVPGAVAAAAGSVSADDRVDLVIAGPNGVGVFYNDGSGNFGLGDTGAPVLKLQGSAEVTLTVGDQYSDAGATATDAVDGDLTSRITVDNPVDPAVIGTYTVTYNVKDLSGNAAAPITRTVKVQANQPAGGGGGGGSAGVLFIVFLAGVALLKRGERSCALVPEAVRSARARRRAS